MRVDRVLNKPVGIIGLARSGLAAAELIKRLGGRPFVSDSKPETELQDRIAGLKAAGIPFETGRHTEKLLLHSEFIIVSPGVPNDVPIILQAEAQGIPIFSELEVASWLCDANLAAITGSNGKTTTTTLLGEIFKAANYKTAAAGNIGFPFSAICDQIPVEGWIALEVSSFQLERIFDFRPKVAVVLNLTPDHLDRYGQFEEYAKIKMRVAENMKVSDYLIINADDDYLMTLASQTAATKILISQKKMVETGIYMDGRMIVFRMGGREGNLGEADQIRIPGAHNLCNAMAAGAAALLAGVPDDIIKATFQRFPGVEHRLEYVDTINGVRFINDSKATNVDSVWYALQSVPEKMILIMGGKYKGGDLALLNDLIRAHVKHLILIGAARERMYEAYENIVDVSMAGSLEEAVGLAYEMAIDGEAVLLSPACASFDMFDDYEHRGRVFKKAVSDLKGLEGK